MATERGFEILMAKPTIPIETPVRRVEPLIPRPMRRPERQPVPTGPVRVEPKVPVPARR